VQRWNERAELPVRRLLGWLGLGTSKFHTWKDRYGQVNEHNGKIPRDFWLEDWEKQAILDFHDRHPLNGYRSLTFMMLDDDIVAVSPTSVYRVLKSAGRLDRKWAVDGGSKWRRGAAEFGSAGLVKVSERQEWCVAEEV
jgi:putative transposase